MTVEAITQPRLDMVVAAHDDTSHILRRTEYRGTLWYGGRPNDPNGPTAMPGAFAQISTPFWLTDSLPYHSELISGALVTASVSVQSAMETPSVADVRAALVRHPSAPDYAYAQLSITASGRLPLGLSYQVVVLSDPDAISD
ncbi:MAG: hypothetical protein ACXIVQ_10150 [Acidimicrobiales bacterium]